MTRGCDITRSGAPRSSDPLSVRTCATSTLTLSTFTPIPSYRPCFCPLVAIPCTTFTHRICICFRDPFRFNRDARLVCSTGHNSCPGDTEVSPFVSLTHTASPLTDDLLAEKRPLTMSQRAIHQLLRKILGSFCPDVRRAIV